MQIAMLSGWHVHAEGYAKAVLENGATIPSVWDEDPERGKKWAEKLGARFCPTYEEILADPEIDGVVVCAPTCMHADILLAAANAGKHIFTEKVMTLTNDSAKAVTEAVRKSGIHFTISLPYKADPRYLLAKHLVDDGSLGQITYARVRNCHSGSIRNWLPPYFYDEALCGGGAMIDLGAHPMYLLQWFLGDARRVSSSFLNATDRPVEDNAVSLIEFDGGKIGVSETGFVSIADPFIVEISGTKGFIQIGRTMTVTIDGKGVETIDPGSIPYHQEPPVPYWLNSIRENTPNEVYTVEEGEALTRIMVAAYQASRTGQKTDL